MNDRAQLKVTAFLALVVTVVILAFLYLMVLPDMSGGEDLLVVLSIAALVSLIPLLMVARKWKDLRGGFPSADERSRRIKERAGFYAFLTTIYVVLGFMYYDLALASLLDGPSLNGTLTCVLINTAAISAFGVFWLWFARRGDSAEGA